MRWVMLVLALGGAGAAIWWLYADRTPVTEATVNRDGVEDPGAKPYMRLKYGTLTVVVKAPDGSAPLGAQVGWDTPEGPRLYYTDKAGRRTLTDVPLGHVRVVVQAPGFARVQRDARVEAGLTEELIVPLTPVPPDTPR